eukprot:354349-Chlamydomonas_euryale.AAC.2
MALHVWSCACVELRVGPGDLLVMPMCGKAHAHIHTSTQVPFCPHLEHGCQCEIGLKVAPAKAQTLLPRPLHLRHDIVNVPSREHAGAFQVF